MGIQDLAGDRMSCDELIFIIAPALSDVERKHCRFVVKRRDILLYFLQTEMADVLGKAFIQPQVIPPFHCD